MDPMSIGKKRSGVYTGRDLAVAQTTAEGKRELMPAGRVFNRTPLTMAAVAGECESGATRCVKTVRGTSRRLNVPDEGSQSHCEKKGLRRGDVVAWPKAISKIRHKHGCDPVCPERQEFSVDLKDVREATDETFNNGE